MKATKSTSIIKPSLFLFLTEAIRALIEWVRALFWITKYQVRQKGDGHPVLVLPGFMTSDISTKPMRRFINKNGYLSYGWELGTNLADISELHILAKKIDAIYQKHGEKISLIGWSLGGVYARILAKEQPEKIRQVITLGSPFGGILEPNNATFTFNFVKWLKKYAEPPPAFFEELPKPPPLPCTAVFSKKDGIVPWQVCKEPLEDNIHQNIEVGSSHLGMGFHTDVLKIILDRLSFNRSNWQLFSKQEKVMV